MSAARAELVGDPHRTEAVAAARRQLIRALRAEMKLILNMGAAGSAERGDRQTEQKIEHRPDATWQHEADHHPESRAHRASRRIPADVPDHQKIKSSQQAPREVEVDAKPKRRRRVMARSRQNEPPVVLDYRKGNHSRDHRPDGNQPRIFVDRKRLWIAHRDVTEE